MAASQIFSTLAHSSLQIFLPFLELVSFALPSIIWNYMVLSVTHFKCAFELLLYNQYSFSAPNFNHYYCHYRNIPNKPAGSEEVIRRTRFEFKEGSKRKNEDNQCAVCLSEVKEGDEIGELRCCHLFHAACLERWMVGFKRVTCPLCRCTLAPPRSGGGEEEIGMEVLFFKFCSFSSNSTSYEDEPDSWWLR
ncbi:43kDa postsynaptic protein [Parasponia andersonii]|uniref:43kDa postsynaptic protein n=1 Tax=Parasponia andersonii TaxID=3476 RepID=A0A2P5B6V8_PARAD|nr:43kDa postsynaptic protein [Parasponia andersonii]